MIAILQPVLGEIEQEAATTRRVLERVPDDKLPWKPHSKSMALGQLAMHIAQVPGAFAHITPLEAFDVSKGSFIPPMPKDRAEIIDTLDASMEAAREFFGSITEESYLGPWRLTRGDQNLLTVPRAGVVRTLMLNHWYHHRGQLSVYLRLLDVPVPSIYGPSADENPFG